MGQKQVVKRYCKVLHKYFDNNRIDAQGSVKVRKAILTNQRYQGGRTLHSNVAKQVLVKNSFDTNVSSQVLKDSSSDILHVLVDRESTLRSNKGRSFNFVLDSDSPSQVDYNDSIICSTQSSITHDSGGKCVTTDISDNVSGSSNLCIEQFSGGRDYCNATNSNNLGLDIAHHSVKDASKDINSVYFNKCFSQACTPTGDHMYNLYSELLNSNMGDNVVTHVGLKQNSHGIDKRDRSGVVKSHPCNLKNNTECFS